MIFNEYFHSVLNKICLKLINNKRKKTAKLIAYLLVPYFFIFLYFAFFLLVNMKLWIGTNNLKFSISIKFNKINSINNFIFLKHNKKVSITKFKRKIKMKI